MTFVEYPDALTMVLDDGSVTFDKAKAKTAPTGCFTVAQPTGFNASDNLAFGLAQKDNTGGETPKSTVSCRCFLGEKKYADSEGTDPGRSEHDHQRPTCRQILCFKGQAGVK